MIGGTDSGVNVDDEDAAAVVVTVVGVKAGFVLAVVVMTTIVPLIFCRCRVSSHS